MFLIYFHLDVTSMKRTFHLNFYCIDQNEYPPTQTLFTKKLKTCQNKKFLNFKYDST